MVKGFICNSQKLADMRGSTITKIYLDLVKARFIGKSYLDLLKAHFISLLIIKDISELLTYKPPSYQID